MRAFAFILCLAVSFVGSCFLGHTSMTIGAPFEDLLWALAMLLGGYFGAVLISVIDPPSQALS